jgi:polyhydroxybutyrate depolymerase
MPSARRPFLFHLPLVLGLAALLLVSSCRSDGQGLREGNAARGGADQQQTDGLARVGFMAGGIERSYYVHVPPALAGRSGLPAVLVFHGGEGDGRDAAAASRMAAAADAQGFVAIFPDSPGSQWNDGRATTASGIDDVGFVRALIGEATLRHGVDPARIFVAGVSNGGMFTQRLVCDAAGSIRAAAVVVANMPADLAPTCVPSRPVPMIFFTGTGDGLMPFEGGEIAAMRRLGVGVGGTVLSQAGTRDFWAGRFGCQTRGEPVALADIADDGTTVSRQSVTGCGGGAELVFFTIAGGGHNWPGSGRGGRFAGTVSQDIDATAEILSFFRRHGL